MLHSKCRAGTLNIVRASIQYTPSSQCKLRLGAFYMSLHEPSWMGLYGGVTPKPSYLMGVGRWPQDMYHASTGRCIELSSPAKLSRRWIKGIRNKLTKERRGQFTTRVVKKKKRSDGSTSVSGTYLANQLQIGTANNIMICLLPQLRTGLPELRSTQVYPPAFGKAIAKLWRDNRSTGSDQDWYMCL